jgi:hypothetical protein
VLGTGLIVRLGGGPEDMLQSNTNTFQAGGALQPVLGTGLIVRLGGGPEDML